MIGYFGASTGAAAALPARRGGQSRRSFPRGGRPVPPVRRFGGARAPTLLIVGGNDPEAWGSSIGWRNAKPAVGDRVDHRRWCDGTSPRTRRFRRRHRRRKIVSGSSSTLTGDRRVVGQSLGW